ncbi:MAG: radical SAM protein [Desulfomonile tiedjei]|nr:radical SAM protein [Desulfomonile tiedjei]
MTRPHILLVNPWIHDFAAYDLWARPVGLLVLASWLRDAGWEPSFVDCLDPDHPKAPPVKVRRHSHGHFHRTSIPVPEPLKGTPRKFSRYGLDPEIVREDLRHVHRPAAILVTSLMTYWYPGVRETIEQLREAFPQTPLLLGGIYASLLPEHAAAHCRPDEVIAGPGEKALAHALFRHTGIRANGNPTSPELRFKPALDLMRQVRFLPLITSRGCPFRCVYCASARLVPRFVRRPASDVIRDIEHAVGRYDIEDVALYDDAFLVDSGRHALPILEAAGRSFPGLRWHSPNGLHASEITPRVAEAMKHAGFETIRIGLESSSDQFHAETGGKTDLRSFLSALAYLKDAGFTRRQIGVYLLVGLPGQTRDCIEDDVEVVLQAGALPKLAEYSPIPQTALWERAVQAARIPIAEEPLFQNCTLLPTAPEGVDSQFLQTLRKRIEEVTNSPRSA